MKIKRYHGLLSNYSVTKRSPISFNKQWKDLQNRITSDRTSAKGDRFLVYIKIDFAQSK
ncbi:hypothetical protein [Pseudanabaena sp. 'Roaring Creek']|uniref:hypothetical protein n=1 Tax=Pseudanabaena sp. 'Roaring Creek' TaxID=1681830 RepID=UPI0012E0F444|nr:hypothetical protein [Pseudanabaena sp. 'Roaring Creek']